MPCQNVATECFIKLMQCNLKSCYNINITEMTNGALHSVCWMAMMWITWHFKQGLNHGLKWYTL